MRKHTIFLALILLTLFLAGCNNRNVQSDNITADQAKSIALAQVPGATTDHIREFDVDYLNNGNLEYEGKIYYHSMEYSFEIDGYNGAIRSWEEEPIYE